jgi:DNA (cytosine-5)-methyltransferase 1
MLTHASLFSGIGGFDLAAEWAGWENIFHCEWNPFGQKVLAHHFPNSKSYHDITKTDFSIHNGTVDVLTGGFPCQPYSSAGKRLGKADERHLFPEMLRAIKEIKPRWVVGENVRGLVSWNEGLVFHEVYADLESEGYEVQSFLIPAAGVNAPHQRYRIWFVAYCNNQVRWGKENNIREWSIEKQESYDRNNVWDNIGSIITSGNVANSNDNQIKYSNNGASTKEKRILRWGKESDVSNSCNSYDVTNSIGGWDNFPTQSPICSGNDGISDRLDGITFSKWRNESIKAYGNAIVPQVAFEIFKAINEFELLVNK